MAERLDKFSHVPIHAGQVWLSRAGVWTLSVVLSILRFHTPIGYPWTFDLFAVVELSWMEREIRYYRSGRGACVRKPGRGQLLDLPDTHPCARATFDARCFERNVAGRILGLLDRSMWNFRHNVLLAR